VGDDADISAELQAVLEALHKGDPQYRRLAERASDAMLLATREGLLVAVSPKAAALLGRTRAGLLSLSLTDLVEGDTTSGDLATLLALRPGQPLERSFGILRGDGKRVAVEVSARRLADGRLQLALDGPAAARRRAAVPHEGETGEEPTPLIMADVYHDAVTGLTSRFLVRDRLSVALAQAYRQRTRVGVVHVDLDGFTATNTELGRDLGDRLLRSVGRRLSDVVREGDTVARLDADAFVMVLTGLQHAADAVRIAEKVRDAVRQPFSLPRRKVSVTASLGAAVFPEHGEDAVALLSVAREAADRARQGGGDRLEVCAAPAPDAGYDPLELEAGLRAGLGSGRLALDGESTPGGVLHYQPIVELATSRVVAVEVLLRWEHPRRGLVFPQNFLSPSDFTGLILAIEPWILKTAAKQALEWQRGTPGLRIAVNLSPPELARKTLPDIVKTVLDETGLPARCLELELPEEPVVSNMPRSLDVLHRLKKLGVSLVLDQMAVRYPFLIRLNEVPVDGVKLDLSFLRDRPAQPEEVSLLGTIGAVARALKLRVSAQGVEGSAQIDVLRRVGCVEGQGFYLGPPAPAAELGERLARQAASPAEGGKP
jgi:diguanylate cyclase (GGDEF)-like protein/PAS domain S-box-containing protein